jgi:tRNA (uracil-5-)-methyltransferase
MRPIDIDPKYYPEQLKQKVDSVNQQFSLLTMPDLEIFESAHLHYRMRAEFRVWHDGDDLFHIMFDQSNKEKYRVDSFPPATKIINAVMSDVITLIKPNDLLRRKLFQIDYLCTLGDEILVSLIYHKALDEAWHEAMNQVLSQLRIKYDIDIIGRSKKLKLVLDKDYVTEHLPVAGKIYQFKQIENSFTQPNAGVNAKMIEWALDVTRDSSGDLLELYCGLGNFSLPMSVNFNRVLATEISKPSVAAAQFNIQTNNIDNVTILRMSSEEFVEALKGTKTFNRLEGIDLQSYNCNTVLVDPPRSGLDDATVDMVSEYTNIVYISCNPDSLKQNLDTLLKTHEVSRFALFDQFPYTHHVECGVYLTRR